MTNLHINSPKGVYYAQVRRRGFRHWEEVGKPFRSNKRAFVAAVSAMFEGEYRRARVLFCADWYDPIVVMEASV